MYVYTTKTTQVDTTVYKMTKEQKNDLESVATGICIYIQLTRFDLFLSNGSVFLCSSGAL